MTKSTTIAVLILFTVSLAMVASCGQEIAGPADDPGTIDAPAALIDSDPPDDDDNGVRTPGYWKNHPASWPVGQLTLGGIVYAKQNCMEMLRQPARGDHSVILCRALVAAKLNVANGCDGACVAPDIVAADAWFAQFTKSSITVPVVPLSTRGGSLADVLDDYNNGLLCAPAGDD
ncbi:MAG: hypothetical protein JSW50_01735 [Candidatus Latescibacterota bacterium]|nr:MAG: hypothetical protein JSW50_01735 [Candidatus Latescibacterota bacterium]